MAARGVLQVYRLGTVTYGDGLAWQHAAAETVRAGGRERLALLEHVPVYTLGARGGIDNLRVAESALPAPLERSSRGGDVTFHGPGQLVAYPVLDLRARGLRAGDYVHALEDVVIRTLAACGLEGRRWLGRPGVWVEGGDDRAALEKIAAIGVRVARGVSAHGLALNVSTDLAWYEPIVPCGIADAGVTSIERAGSSAHGLPEISAALVRAFGAVFDVEVVAAGDAAVSRGAGEPVHA